MTVCVVVKKDGKVYIGTDSFWGGCYDQMPSGINTDKIVDFGTFKVAISGSGNLRDALEIYKAKFKVPIKINSKLAARNFAKKLFVIWKGLGKEGCHSEEEAEEEISGGRFLIATPKEIYQVYGNLSVFTHERFQAIGAGDRFALGALEALYDLDITGLAIITKALEAACKLSPLCSEPLDIRLVK